ncbi:hypothetical protein K431DRAFT_9525 [Polychaeton citri CBS 116435]|uniref:Uncharacterized protein n=1 Tax=Polychaeton citri CBS 116435 TaxID=1314669 RepID=A0A9P4USN0_9PEZI|nr:hypothetical protein K431DRAFT_9525 [Polychaeton citri CBS 116435]
MLKCGRRVPLYPNGHLRKSFEAFLASLKLIWVHREPATSGFAVAIPFLALTCLPSGLISSYCPGPLCGSCGIRDVKLRPDTRYALLIRHSRSGKPEMSLQICLN